MKIGVFDSGIGGLSTLTEILRVVPDADVCYIGDREHCPYGEKSAEELTEIATGIAQRLIDWGAEIIVVACNTATTCCIKELRRRFPAVRFVGTEPAVKVAEDRGLSDVLVLATPLTCARLLGAAGFEAGGARVMTRDFGGVRLLACYGLAEAIERAAVVEGVEGEGSFELVLKPGDEMPAVYLRETAEVEEILDKLLAGVKCRAVVLGCTHYGFVKEGIVGRLGSSDVGVEVIDGNEGASSAGFVEVIDGNEGVGRRVKELVDKVSSCQESL